MDNLTAKKKLQLFSDCLKAQDYVGLVHLDVKKMYAFLNTESDDINVEYVECIGYNARQASDSAIDYVSKRGACPSFLIQWNIKFYSIQLNLINTCKSSIPTTAYINQTKINCTTI